MDREWWTRGGVDSPLARVLIAVAAVGIFGGLLHFGVIKTRSPRKDACGGCERGSVCVSIEQVNRQGQKLTSLSDSTPECLRRCDVLRPSCPTGLECKVVTGGGACFPAEVTVGEQEDTSSAAQVRMGGSPSGRRNRLPFEIIQSHERQALANAPPWHSGSGDWTFFDARTPGGANFGVGLHEVRRITSTPPMVLLEVRLFAPTRSDGAKFVTEYAEAFGLPAPGQGPTRALTPLAASSVVLHEKASRQSDGSFSGEGTWSASKWTIERADHAAEVYFNYSPTERQGEFSQKDASYDADVLTDFATALRDGLGSGNQ